MLDYILQSENSSSNHTQNTLCDICLGIGNYKVYETGLWEEATLAAELGPSQCTAVAEGIAD